jgi:hypothetical protein
MINGAKVQGPDIVKNGYDDWIELLEHTGNKDLLDDPYNIWLEAFHVATLVERQGILNLIQTQVKLAEPREGDVAAIMSVMDVKQLQLNLLKQVIEVIASKGLHRQGPTGLPMGST